MDFPLSFPTPALTSRLRSRFLAFFLGMILLTGPDKTTAGNMYSYDLDSLVFMSDQILHGQFIATDPEAPQQTLTLQVTATWMGAAQPGDTIPILGTDFYHIPGPQVYGPGYQLGQEDEVIVFLRRPSTDPFRRIKYVEGAYFPVPAGIKVIQEGRTHSFRQFMNPGGYVLDVPADPSLDPEVSELERQCREIIITLRPIKERLGRPAEKADLPWLLDLLRSRRDVETNFYNRRDAISEAACLKLVEIKDLPALDEALRLTKSWHGIRELHRGFSSREARTHLLHRLLDPSLTSPETRGLYSHALRYAAWDYTAASPEPESFFVPLAGLIVDFTQQGDEASALILMEHLHAPTSSPPKEAMPPTNAEQDRMAALKVLNAAYPQIRAPQVRYQMDRIALVTPEAFDFASKLGPVASLVTLAAADSGMLRKPGHLTCAVSYHSGPAAQGRSFQLELILENQTTHQEWPLSTQTAIIGGNSGGGFLQPLPPDLPAGPYRLFPRLLENSHPISTGQGISLDLPLPED